MRGSMRSFDLSRRFRDRRLLRPRRDRAGQEQLLIKRLGLADDEKLDRGMTAAIEEYGTSNRNKYRPVLYYLLAERFDAVSRV